MSEKVPYERLLNPQPVRRGGLHGCVVAALIALGLFVVIAVVTVVVGQRYLAGVVAEYSSPDPAKLAEFTISNADWAALERRVKAFQAKVEAGEPAELELSGQDLNALIQKNPEAGEIKDRVRLEIKSDELLGDVSVPLDGLGLEMFKGRWLNGQGAFAVALQNGALAVNLRELKVNGKPLPDQFMTQLKAHNLAENAQKDPKLGETLRHVESLEVMDGKLRLKVKARPTSEPDSEPVKK